jgi:hypothetical protein
VREERGIAHQLVGQEHGEGLVPDGLGGAPDGMAEALGGVLVDDGDPPVGADPADAIGKLVRPLASSVSSTSGDGSK